VGKRAFIVPSQETEWKKAKRGGLLPLSINQGYNLESIIRGSTAFLLKSSDPTNKYESHRKLASQERLNFQGGRKRKRGVETRDRKVKIRYSEREESHHGSKRLLERMKKKTKLDGCGKPGSWMSVSIQAGKTNQHKLNGQFANWILALTP